MLEMSCRSSKPRSSVDMPHLLPQTHVHCTGLPGRGIECGWVYPLSIHRSWNPASYMAPRMRELFRRVGSLTGSIDEASCTTSPISWCDARVVWRHRVLHGGFSVRVWAQCLRIRECRYRVALLYCRISFHPPRPPFACAGVSGGIFNRHPHVRFAHQLTPFTTDALRPRYRRLNSYSPSVEIIHFSPRNLTHMPGLISSR